MVKPIHAERKYITLLCTMNSTSDRVLGYYVIARMDWLTSHRLYRNDPCLRAAKKLNSLSDFCTVVKNLGAGKSSGSF